MAELAQPRQTPRVPARAHQRRQLHSLDEQDWQQTLDNTGNRRALEIIGHRSRQYQNNAHSPMKSFFALLQTVNPTTELPTYIRDPYREIWSQQQATGIRRRNGGAEGTADDSAETTATKKRGLTMRIRQIPVEKKPDPDALIWDEINASLKPLLDSLDKDHRYLFLGSGSSDFCRISLVVSTDRKSEQEHQKPTKRTAAINMAAAIEPLPVEADVVATDDDGASFDERIGQPMWTPYLVPSDCSAAKTKQILGNDLSAIQPSWVPPNVKFEIDDVESPWIEDKKYDYIFVRHMLISIADWPRLVKNVFDHLNPGGWAEFQDMDVQYYSDDGTYTEDHQTRKWNKDLVRACEMIGRTGRPGPQLKDWITDAGFQQVTHQRFKCPMGPWPKDPQYKEVGMLNLIQLLDGLEGFSLKLCCDVLGQSREEVLARLKKVREELKDPSMHSIFDHHVVYGQKPERSD
ncbi:umta methyltransferase family protein [Colletotrichum camelliae]|nr:umta methyltransferase family protein [Colletotrichum camelliae]